MFVAQLSKLDHILKRLQKEYNVLVPTKNTDTSGSSDSSGFAALDDNTQIFLEGNVKRSPKEVFFPQTEPMYTFKSVKNSVEIENIPDKKEKTLIFGIRSCDMKSLDCLDQVFLTKGFVDEFYNKKRENAVTIALACNQAGSACFCAGMGVDPQKAKGADIQAYLIGDQIGLEPLTSTGHQVMELIKGEMSEENIEIPQFGAFELKVDANGVPEKLKTMFESEIWDEIARKCLNCGACTYVCPTCHCFDISQDVRGEEGVKYRCWDSCMFGDYTQMAGGHNPRSGKKERVRNRFMHKLSYFPERYGMLLCTGCGRCIHVCPVNLDITSVIKTIKEAE